MQKIEFIGYNPHIQTFQSNHDSFRFSIEFGKEGLTVIQSILLLPQGEYKVTIEPIASEIRLPDDLDEESAEV